MAPLARCPLRLLCAVLGLSVVLCDVGSQPAAKTFDVQAPSLAARSLLQSCLQMRVFVKYYDAGTCTAFYLPSVSNAIALANSGGANICPSVSCIAGDDASLDMALASGGFDILLGLNDDNGASIWGESTSLNVATALTSGTISKLLVYDRYADYDVKVPGLSPGLVTRDFLEPDGVEPVRPGMPTSTGPAGEVGPFTGCSSNHGFISTAFINADHIAYYQRQQSKKPIDVEYCFGKGKVFYSTNPLDFYLLYNGPYGCDGGASVKLFTNTLAFLAGRTCASAPVCPTVVASRSWVPPNNKFIDISLLRVPTDVNNNIVSVDATGCSSTDPSNLRFGPDCILKINGTVSVRAKRNGKSDGRLYKIDYLAKDATGLNCTGQAFVCIPHDASNSTRVLNATNSNPGKVKAVCPDASTATFVDVTV